MGPFGRVTIPVSQVTMRQYGVYYPGRMEGMDVPDGVLLLMHRLRAVQGDFSSASGKESRRELINYYYFISEKQKREKRESGSTTTRAEH